MNLSLEQEFLHKVYQDIEQNLKQANILVQKIIGQVIFKEIQAYQTAKSRASELFNGALKQINKARQKGNQNQFDHSFVVQVYSLLHKI